MSLKDFGMGVVHGTFAIPIYVYNLNSHYKRKAYVMGGFIAATSSIAVMGFGLHKMYINDPNQADLLNVISGLLLIGTNGMSIGNVLENVIKSYSKTNQEKKTETKKPKEPTNVDPWCDLEEPAKKETDPWVKLESVIQ
ncbi:hypothetical protein HZA97_04665 [Candidatus Woesearchaeota archaeon]|nr:hypothetical protein [Candidatus Woesearchaeota archaeon]